MCGRYVLNQPQDLSERFQLRQLTIQLGPSFNTAPTSEMPVILETEEGVRAAELMRWGLEPRWSRPGQKAVTPFNARSETLTEKPMFRNLIKRSRCLVPANGFYEWQTLDDGSKQPWYIELKDSELFAFAGLYDEVADGDGEVTGSYTIITTEPNELMAELHNRMPVILPADDEEEWLDRAVTEAQQVKRLLRPYPADAMEAYRVSKAVNNVRNQGPELIEPLEDAAADL